MILLTGGLGLVGAHLIPRLLATAPGSDITIIDNRSAGAVPEALGALIGDQVHVVTGNAAESGLVDHLVAQADTVIHLAAATSVDRSIEDPASCTSNNVGATVALIDAVRRHRPAHVLVVSTDEVWGSIAEPDLANEDTPYRPTNPYAASKAASDHLIAAANNTYGLGITTVYFTTLYGPWQLPGKLISTTVRNRLTDQPIPIHGPGNAVREFTYVTDAVDGLIAALDGPPGESFVIGSGVRYTALDAAAHVNGLLGAPEENWYVTVGERPGCDQRYAVDATKARNKLGWAPQVDFDDGIARTASWWRAAGLEIAGDDRHHARRADKAPGCPSPPPASATVAQPAQPGAA